MEWFLHHRADLFDQLEVIVSGADQLIHSFEPLLADAVRLGCAVERVDQNEAGVVLHYRSAFRRRTLEADACILTLPFCLMRTMEISGVDPAKSYAIRNCYYGRAHKIFMQFRRRWWQSDDGIRQGISTTDLGIRTIVYPPVGQDHRGGRGMLLASYAWENDSAAFSPLGEEQRLAQALEDLAKIHPAALDTYEWGMSHDWSQDPWAGGIGPLFRPLEMGGPMFSDLVRPVGRIHFANDACDRYHRRWIEGAIASAIRTALTLHA
ncbi:MAG: flavin monoamine oxidase family protein [Cyanobium sp.]